MKASELLRELSSMVTDTKAGKIHWRVEVSTTEYKNEADKPKIMAEGETWIADECYVSYYCEYKGKEFLLITYEMISKAGTKQKTTNLVFMPPLGIRFFDLNALMPYAIEADQMLTYSIHQLWMTILETKKSRPELIDLDANERELTIEGIQ